VAPWEGGGSITPLLLTMMEGKKTTWKLEKIKKKDEPKGLFFTKGKLKRGGLIFGFNYPEKSERVGVSKKITFTRIQLPPLQSRYLSLSKRGRRVSSVETRNLYTEV